MFSGRLLSFNMQMWRKWQTSWLRVASRQWKNLIF